MKPLIQPAVDLIKRYEGFRATAYLCPSKVPTIGYGHTAGVTTADVGRRTITETEADQLLRGDLAASQTAVERLVEVPLTPGEYGALVSFIFNCGSGNFERSGLLAKLNHGRYQDAAEEFGLWIHGRDHVVLPGLVARRAAEKALFCGGYDLGEKQGV